MGLFRSVCMSPLPNAYISRPKFDTSQSFGFSFYSIVGFYPEETNSKIEERSKWTDISPKRSPIIS